MFYRTNNNELIDYADYKYDSACKQTSIISVDILEKYPNKVIVQDGELILNPNFEQEALIRERESLNQLSLTRADVERAIYKAKGMDFDDIVAQVETLKQVQGDSLNIDLKALKIELKANNFYRGNPYVNQIGLILGFTEEMLDEFFKTNDYTKLLPETPKGEAADDPNI